MNQSVSEKEISEKNEQRRKTLLFVGAGAAATLAIAGAGFSIWSSQGVSRAERIAAKGGPEVGQRPGGERRGNGERGNSERRGGEQGGRGNFAQRREQQSAQMAAELGLTADQQKQMKAVGESMRPQMQALWQNKSLSREDRRTQMQAMRAQSQAKMRALMTPEQQQRFDAMQAQRQARRQEMRQRREQTRAAVIASGQTPPQRGRRPGGRGR
jgi:hypothetical protein